MNPSAEVLAAVRRALISEALYRIGVNAECGYVLDLPAPEVFERPGWTTLQAHPGAEVIVFTEEEAMVLVSGPSEQIPLTMPKLHGIRPWLTMVYRVHPEREQTAVAGLGFDVDHRRFGFFPRLPDVPRGTS